MKNKLPSSLRGIKDTIAVIGGLVALYTAMVKLIETTPAYFASAMMLIIAVTAWFYGRNGKETETGG